MVAIWVKQVHVPADKSWNFDYETLIPNDPHWSKHWSKHQTLVPIDRANHPQPPLGDTWVKVVLTNLAFQDLQSLGELKWPITLAEISAHPSRNFGWPKPKFGLTHPKKLTLPKVRHTPSAGSTHNLRGMFISIVDKKHTPISWGACLNQKAIRS